MGSTEPDWRTVASAKRDAVLDKIPREWRLPHPIPSATEIPDVTGDYVQQFLNSREIKITETDAVDIVKKTGSGQWTAVEVTKAFCHRAAIAHQLVCFRGSARVCFAI